MEDLKKNIKSFVETYKLKKGKISWVDLEKSEILSSYRKKIVFGLLNIVMNQVECVEKCRVVSVGSENIKSDLDITVTGKKSVEIVDLFNEIFTSLFEGSSQQVFDTNLYATTFIFEPEQPNYKMVVNKKKILYFIETKGLDDASQLSFALVKLIENANQEQMKIIIKNIPDKVLKDAFVLFSELRNDKKDYIKQIKKMRELKNKFETAEGKDKLQAAIELKRQISVSNFHSEETYYTQGSFFHVVGKIQSGFKFLPITKQEYICSVIENTGFLLENYNKSSVIKEKYLKRIKDAFDSIKIQFKISKDKNKIKTNIVENILETILKKIKF